jgi:serine-type D-Ala-D-Ala carboxypeptidase (penicillin-binding protein 5/6)
MLKLRKPWLLLFAAFAMTALVTTSDAQQRRRQPPQPPQQVQPKPVPNDVSAVATKSREALLIDADTGAVLFEKEADSPMPPASMSKIMTMYMLFREMKEGRVKFEDQFPVSEKAWRTGGSKMFVHVGDRVKVEDLIRGVIVQSGNDACVVIAEALAGSEEAFAERMTQFSRTIGLTASVFKNATGLPDPGHIMTARDLAILANRIIRDFPEFYKFYSELSFTYAGIRQGNRNPLLYKNMGVDGLKTGHTDEAGFGLTASAQRDGRRLIMVITGTGNMNERSAEAERLMEWGFRNFENVTIGRGGASFADAEVWLGETEKVAIVSEKDIVMTVPRAARRSVKVSVVYDGPVPAPIAKGAGIATLVVEAPNLGRQEFPLVAANDVARQGLVGRMVAVLSHLVFGPGK